MVMKSALEVPFWYSRDNRLSAGVCDEIIAEGKRLNILAAGTNKGGVSEATKLDRSIRRSEAAFFPLGNELEVLLKEYVDKANRAAWNFRMAGHEPIQFGMYKRKGFYNWHRDTFYKPNMPIRKLSVTVNLSDPKDYSGGNLLIKNIQDSELDMLMLELRKRGTVIVFPSFLQHRVSEVQGGTRYSLVQWLHGPDFV